MTPRNVIALWIAVAAGLCGCSQSSPVDEVDAGDSGDAGDAGDASDDSPCPAGLVPGGCGLEGECVECLVDEDCQPGQACAEQGACHAFAPCGPENACAPDEHCADDGRCWPSCRYPQACPHEARCVDRTYCFQARCGADGRCPDGWVPVSGSLLCEIESCERWGFVEGGCGLAGLCLECLTDLDCEHGTCDLFGVCMVGSPQCSYDDDCDIVDPRALCIGHKCEIPCESIIDCPYWQDCQDGWCVTERCHPDGTCPEGWEPSEGGLLCIYDPGCSEHGLVLGGCGLSGTCVECLTDADCDGACCNLHGRCDPPGCLTDADCGLESLRCVRGQCVLACEDAEDCPEDRICDPSTGACRPVRCDEIGRCGVRGWRPVEGTLQCTYDPCYWMPGNMTGVCGLADECVECVVSADCPAGQACNMHGDCRDEPECEQDRDCDRYDEVCVDGGCRMACESGAECRMGMGICTQEGFCFFERCSAEGTCPDGWIPGTPEWLPGMLACAKAW